MCASLIHNKIYHQCTIPLENLRMRFRDQCNCGANASESLFYCNNPEQIYEKHLADNGKYLTRNKVEGIGQIYTWHENKTSSAIHNTILAYNHNSFPITITCTNYGTTNHPYSSDVLAWKNYFDGVGRKAITIPAYGYANLFMIENIPRNNAFGVLSRYIIDAPGIDPNNEPRATVTLFDLVYQDPAKSGNGQSIADNDGDDSRPRGAGVGFFMNIEVEFPYCVLGKEEGALIGGTNATRDVTIQNPPSNQVDTFYDHDLINVYDEGEKAPYEIYGKLRKTFGNFGVEMQCKIDVVNTSDIAKHYHVFIGSAGGLSYPIVSLNGETLYQTEPLNEWTCREVIDVYVPAHDGEQFSFLLAIPARSSAPYIIGVREV